ncbi:MAG: FAD-binding protein, partial [Burkholderiales bacterium]|nr:FAD-binding protein [Burkholderiales bacterium]
MALYIQENTCLRNFNTFSVPAMARRLFFITSLHDLREASDLLLMTSEQRVLFLGAGSDILFAQDFPGAVLLNRLRGVEVTEDGDWYHVKAASGEPWHEFVAYTIENGMPGLENLSLIPGTVGGGVIQNIGAYGREIADFIYEVECFSIRTGEYFVFNNEECDFRYRSSVFKSPANSDLFITAVSFRLPKRCRTWLQYKDISEVHSSQPTDE